MLGLYFDFLPSFLLMSGRTYRYICLIKLQKKTLMLINALSNSEHKTVSLSPQFVSEAPYQINTPLLVGKEPVPLQLGFTDHRLCITFLQDILMGDALDQTY